MRQALVTLVTAIFTALVATAAFASPTTAQDVSANWSGFAATGVNSTSTVADPNTTFTDVTGTWTQPAATCTAGQSTSAAVWVGLGGYSETSQALEQTGTEVDCDADGTPTYFAWYELVPADSVQTKLKIFPGNVITASVVVNGTNVLVQIKNRTRHTTFTKRLTMTSPPPDLTSADWIAESPDLCNSFGNCVTATLTNFGSVTFSKIAATANGEAGRLTGPGWQPTDLTLVPQSRHGRFFGDPASVTSSGAGATTANVLPDGSGFTVNWLANASAPATSTTA